MLAIETIRRLGGGAVAGQVERGAAEFRRQRLHLRVPVLERAAKAVHEDHTRALRAGDTEVDVAGSRLRVRQGQGPACGERASGAGEDEGSSRQGGTSGS